jgi:hypothetical protein
VRRSIALNPKPLRQQRSEMRNSCVTAVFLSIALALVMSLPAAAQSSTQPSAQSEPPAAAPAQSAPSEPAPSRAAPSQAAPDQAGAAGQASPGHAQAQAHTDEDNPLNLTDDQKAKLRPILMEENQQLEGLRNDTSMTQAQKVAKSNEIRQVASPKIRAILTPEQLQKLADLQQKARQQQNQSPPANAAPAPQK